MYLREAESYVLHASELGQKAVGLRMGIAQTFRILGSLGQSAMTKLEFGEKARDWWHATRYPRNGITSYPDFDANVSICKTLIDLARSEVDALGYTD